MELSCPLGITRCFPQEHFPRKPCNKSFVDQVCSVKMAGYCTRSFFFEVYGSRLRLGPLTRKRGTWSISSLIIWPAPRAGKMKQILRCYWLPERPRWSHLARSGLPVASRMKNFHESHIINPLLTKLVRSRWLDIGLQTASRSMNTQKKNLANIQPS